MKVHERDSAVTACHMKGGAGVCRDAEAQEGDNEKADPNVLGSF